MLDRPPYFAYAWRLCHFGLPKRVKDQIHKDILCIYLSARQLATKNCPFPQTPKNVNSKCQRMARGNPDDLLSTTHIWPVILPWLTACANTSRWMCPTWLEKLPAYSCPLNCLGLTNQPSENMQSPPITPTPVILTWKTLLSSLDRNFLSDI